MKKSVLAIAAMLLFMTLRISAHHAFAAEYDEHRHVTISGMVTTFKWINPHAWLYVEGKDKDGKVANWRFENGQSGRPCFAGMDKGGVEDGRSSHGGGVRYEGRQQSGQCDHRHLTGWTETVRRLRNNSRCSREVKAFHVAQTGQR
jgi:hypothetical protein